MIDDAAIKDEVELCLSINKPTRKLEGTRLGAKLLHRSREHVLYCTTVRTAHHRWVRPVNANELNWHLLREEAIAGVIRAWLVVLYLLCTEV